MEMMAKLRDIICEQLFLTFLQNYMNIIGLFI